MTRLLSKGIAHLTDGGSIQEYMSRPQVARLSDEQRKEIESLMQTAARLLRLRTVPIPDPELQAANRAWFLGHAVRLREEQEARAKRGWSRVRVQLRHGLVRIALVVVLLLAVGGGAASVSASSLPGSALYSLKLATEDLRLALTLNPASRVQLNIRFANERTSEMMRMAKEGRVPGDAVIERMERQLYQALLTAESSSIEKRRGLLEQMVTNTDSQQEELRRASLEAGPETQPVLVAGIAALRRASEQAQEALDDLPTATPVAATPAPGDAPSQPTAVATLTPHPPTNTPGKPPAMVARTATPSAPTKPVTGTPTPDDASAQATSTATYAPNIFPTTTLTPAEPSRTPGDTKEPSPQPSHTAEPATPTSSGVPEPTRTPLIEFRITKADRGDPVPASYRIHYEICIINDGDVPLTNVVVLDRWSPISRAYLPPNNPPEKLWNIGTVEAHERRCLQFSLNTYSTAGGSTVTNRVVMTCDQGTAEASETTHVGPTPAITSTLTLTPTLTVTLVVTPTNTHTASETPTPTNTATPSASKKPWP